MPRPPRIQYAGAWHHVFNRGSSHHATFLDPLDHRRFLDLLRESVSRYDIEVHGYCLLGNHYHLLLRTPTPILDVTMQFLIGTYTRHFNDRHGRDGALFRGRYASLIVESEAYLLAVSRYIHRNALDTGAAHVSEYPWSSYRAYIGDQPAPEWLRVQTLLGLAGGREVYEHLVESPVETSIDRFYEQPRLPPVLDAHPVASGRRGSDP